MTRRRLLLIALAALSGLLTYGYLDFRADIKKARNALELHETRAIKTASGPVAFIDRGDGFPVLSIHGTGGGYDQGLELAKGLLSNGHRVIAPSRFGYPGSPAPDRNDAAAQADAFAELLDILGVRRAVITGASAGAISALHFAARHPERAAALLVMVPAYYPKSDSAPEPWSPLLTWAVTSALQSDFLFWAGQTLLPETFASMILATDREILKAASKTERARLEELLAMIQPISERSIGLLLDARNTAAPLPVDLSAISAPAFVASAEDDRYLTAGSARMIAGAIPDAQLLITPDGGHVWVNRQAEIDRAVTEFLSKALDDD